MSRNAKPKSPSEGLARVVLYVSTATAPQQDTSDALDFQREHLRQTCHQRGWEVVGEYDDAGPSMTLRPGLARLLAAAARNERAFDKVLVESLSRISRSSVIARQTIAALEGAGIEIVSFTENLQQGAALWLAVMDVMSESSRDRRAAPVGRARAHSKAGSRRAETENLDA